MEREVGDPVGAGAVVLLLLGRSILVGRRPETEAKVLTRVFFLERMWEKTDGLRAEGVVETEIADEVRG